MINPLNLIYLYLITIVTSPFGMNMIKKDVAMCQKTNTIYEYGYNKLNNFKVCNIFQVYM